MKEVVELGKTVEETTENLEHLLSVLRPAYEQLGAVCSEIESKSQALKDASDVENHLGTFLQTLHKAEGNLDSAEAEVIDKLHELQQITAKAAELEVSKQTIIAIDSAFEAEFTKIETEFDGELTEVEGAFAEMAGTVSQLEESLKEAIVDTRESFNNLEQAITETQQQVETFSKLDTDFNELISDISETHKEEIETSFSELSEQLRQEQMHELTTCFDNSETHLTDLFDNFSSDVEETADKYKEDNSEFISDFAKECENTFKADIESVAEETTGQITQDLMGEVDESKTLMSSGLSTTAELSSIVPEIVTAGNVVENANDYLEEIAVG